jgi:hypothetical protein
VAQLAQLTEGLALTLDEDDKNKNIIVVIIIIIIIIIITLRHWYLVSGTGMARNTIVSNVTSYRVSFLSYP